LRWRRPNHYVVFMLSEKQFPHITYFIETVETKS
jgi:hypothetical protein